MGKIFIINNNKIKAINLNKENFINYINICKSHNGKYNPAAKIWEIDDNNINSAIREFKLFADVEFLTREEFENIMKTVLIKYDNKTNTIRIKKIYRDKDNNLSLIFSNKYGELPFLVSYDKEKHERIIIGIPCAEEAIKVLKKHGYRIIIDKSYKNEKEKFLLERPQPNIGCSVKLFNHQIRAFEYLINRDCAIIGACMGSGKTLIALSKIKYEKDKGNKIKCLIVCPKIVLLQWKNEIERFFPNTFKIQAIKNGKTDLDPYIDIYIINYELVHKYNFTFCKQIIIDECHYIKNIKTKRYKALKNIISSFKTRILLSGTAVKNKKEELLAQISICLNEPYIKIYNKYNFCSLGDFWYQIQDFYFNLPKSEVLYFLPPKINEVHFIEGECIPIPPSIDLIQKYRFHLAKDKINYTIEYIKNILESDEDNNILVFSEYIETCKAIYEKFKDIAIYHDGSFSIDKRSNIIKDFMTNIEKRIFISTRQSLNVGVNLTKCNRIIFNDIPWNAADIIQAEDRCHRIGQNNKVISTWVINNNSLFDNILYSIILKKYKIQKIILEGKKVSIEEEQYLNTNIIKLLNLDTTGKE